MKTNLFGTLSARRVVARLLTMVMALQGVFVIGPTPAQAVIATGADAQYVIAQSPFYHQNTGLNAKSFNSAELHVAYAAAAQRLFVSDTSQNRVLVFDAATISDGEDALYVIGQPDFTTATAATTQSGLSAPRGLEFDGTNNILYVADTGNDRVLAYDFDVNTLATGMNATRVLGHDDFITSGFATAQDRMRFPHDVALGTDTSTNDRLYVADYSNGRVLVFDVTSISNGEDAVNVLGKPDFTTGGSGTSQAALGTPAGLAMDITNDRLFVSEMDSNRILMFNVSSIADGEDAINVLGQEDFISSSGLGGIKGRRPMVGLAYDSGTGFLYAVSNAQNSVLVFDVNAVSDYEDAIKVLGQPDFDSLDYNQPHNDAAWPSPAGLDYPHGVAIDTAGDRLFVGDNGNARVLAYDIAALTDGEAAVNLLGQHPFEVEGNIAYTAPEVGGEAFGIAYDTVNDRVFVADDYSNRVLVFDATALENGMAASYVLGQPDLVTANADPAADDNFGEVSGLAFDPDTEFLYVADGTYNRIMVFDLSTTITNGMSATYVIGQPDFVTDVANTTQDGLSYPDGLAFDTTANLLFASDNANNRVLVYDASSVSTGMDATYAIGQTLFTTSTSGTTVSTLFNPVGIAVDPVDELLYVSDLNNARVMVFDTGALANGMNASHAIGQADFTSSSTGTTASTLMGPYDVTLDVDGGQIFVSDLDNNRVLVYAASGLATGMSATYVLGQPNLTSGTANLTRNGMGSPAGLEFDTETDLLYVGDTNYNRVLIFDGASAFTATNDPTLDNVITASRLKAGASSTYNFGFTLQNAVSGTLTITFPAGFTVTAAATSGACTGGTVGTFGFTSSTLTAVKSGCTAGALTLSGATVTNHSTPGAYTISWVNDDPGEGVIYIIDDDQVTVTGNVDPSLTFNAGMQDDATACDGTFSGNGGTLALGVLTTGAVTTSDASGVDHICTRLSTNASGGASVTVRSLNGTDGLKSTSVPTDTIPSSTATLSAGTAGYGLCAGSAGGDSGNDVISGAAAPTRSAPFNTTCTNAAHNVGGLTTSAQNLWTLTGPSQNAFVRTYVKAAISGTTAAHADYADTLTFIGTGTF